MTRSQGPSQGPSATASTSATGGADGWEWPPRPWLEEPPALNESPRTRQGSFMFLWAQQDIHTALLAVLWTRSTGLGSAAAGGLESATIRRAWVSDYPAGLSQRQSGGLESAAGRRHDLPQTAGLGEPRTAAAISREWRAGWAADSGVISRERRAWGSSNPGTRQPAGGLGIATASGGYLPRSAGMRARGQRTRRTPTPTWRGLGRKDEWRLPCRGTNKSISKTEHKTRWRGAAYFLVWSSVTVHTAGRNEEHADEDKLK